METGLQNELNEWLYRSEVLWRQKSRELWLKEGDKNSRFFHLSTIVRRRRYSIEAVKDNAGDWVTEPKEIRNVFLENFKILFSEEEVETPQQLDDLVNPCISDVENQLLCSIPSLEDIKNTLFQMSDLKSLGPNGFLVLFYKEY